MSEFQVLAYESALLFVPQSTWLALRMLMSGDETAAAVLLREVPAIGVVARDELQYYQNYSTELLGVVEFVLNRAMRVLATLSDHDPEDAVPAATAEDWREVRLLARVPCPADPSVDWRLLWASSRSSPAGLYQSPHR